MGRATFTDSSVPVDEGRGQNRREEGERCSVHVREEGRWRVGKTFNGSVKVTWLPLSSFLIHVLLLHIHNEYIIHV